MKPKKLLKWAFIFSSLSIFTLVTFNGIMGNGPRAAIANVMSENEIDGSYGVVTFSDSEPTGNSVLKRLGKFFSDDVICSVSPDQFSQLSETYDTVLDQVTVNGETIDIARIGGEKLNSRILRDYLEATGSESKCKVVKAKQWFYLLFSANIS